VLFKNKQNRDINWVCKAIFVIEVRTFGPCAGRRFDSLRPICNPSVKGQYTRSNGFAIRWKSLLAPPAPMDLQSVGKVYQQIANLLERQMERQPE
jgi:hypothetical protein